MIPRAAGRARVLEPIVADRPYVLLSCSVSLDGYLDSASTKRLTLSNDADFDRVDGVRADCDAIMVGAATVRNDNPRLLVRSPARREQRVARGAPESPVKVTVTSSGDLDPESHFFTAGTVDKLVYCSGEAAARLRDLPAGRATVIDLGPCLDVRAVCEDLCARGVNRLMVEGGGSLHTQFLTSGLADELQLVIAPFFVGDSRAPRFALNGCYPWGPERRATLAGVRQLGDVVLLRYALSPRFDAERSDS